MLRSRSEQLKLGVGRARGVDESFATKREGIKWVGEAQAFEFKGGAHGRSTGIVDERSRRYVDASQPKLRRYFS